MGPNPGDKNELFAGGLLVVRVRDTRVREGGVSLVQTLSELGQPTRAGCGEHELIRFSGLERVASAFVV